MNEIFCKELELKEMREKVKKCVRETYLELEKILDEEKPSVYGRNKSPCVFVHTEIP